MIENPPLLTIHRGHAGPDLIAQAQRSGQSGHC
jgi:hypothetical protein